MNTTLAIVMSGFFFVVGLLFSPVIYRLFRQQDEKQPFVIDTPETKATVWTIIAGALAISLASILFLYFAQTLPVSTISPLIISLATSIFGLASASLIGQVVFELALRKQLLDQFSRTLTNAILLDKNNLERLFSSQKVQSIIKNCLEVRVPNIELASGIYQYIEPYINDNKVVRHPRWNFEDSISFFSLQESSKLSSKYFLVKETIWFESNHYDQENLFLSFVRTPHRLRNLFNDPKCIYRWLIEGSKDDFGCLMDENLINALVKIDGLECEMLSPIIIDGEEIRFSFKCQNDFVVKNRHSYQLTLTHVQTTQNPFLTIHLAYPVYQAKIEFQFGTANIKEAQCLTFFTSAIHEDSISIDTRMDKITVRLNNHWILPDQGLLFVW